MVQRKKKKNSSRKIPPNRGADKQAYSDFVVALENLYALFETFSEAQDTLSEKVDRVDHRLEMLTKRLDVLELKVSQIEAKVEQLAEDVAEIKQEIRLIRHDLTQKVNREEFEILAERVAKLEKELAIR